MWTSKPMFVLSSLALSALFVAFAPSKDPKALVEEMVREVGGVGNLCALKDVAYKYIYRDLSTGKEDVSIERYVFDGELSWARYLKRENSLFPQIEGEVIQGYDGKETWLTIDGKLVEEPQQLRIADFLRKTNYYWFTMMFKLVDPGVLYEYQGTQTVDGIEYDLVKIGFEEGVGDVQDTYVLYINPETKLVDQFLFTVLDFGMKDPHLMKVEYEEIQGLKLPTKRIYLAADWNGVPKDDKRVAELSQDVEFNNGFTRSLFEKPSS